MDAVGRARDFFANQGRAIDRARFAHHFDGGSLEAMLAALAGHQNDDGGFGRGLEPDIAAPESNPFATELALTICLQADVPRDHPLLARTVAYLEASQDPAGDWRFVPAIYAHPLAPWFQGWEFPNLNPACTTAGLLRDLGLGSAALHGSVAALFDRLARPDDLVTGDFYGVRPYAYYFLADQQHPQRDLYRAGVLWWLIRQHVEGTSPDAGHFFEYARTPHTFAGRLLPAAIVAAQLDRLQAEQADDGGWPSPYNEAWRGWVTVQSLLTLRAFGRL